MAGYAGDPPVPLEAEADEDALVADEPDDEDAESELASLDPQASKIDEMLTNAMTRDS